MYHAHLPHLLADLAREIALDDSPDPTAGQLIHVQRNGANASDWFAYIKLAPAVARAILEAAAAIRENPNAVERWNNYDRAETARLIANLRAEYQGQQPPAPTRPADTRTLREIFQ
jgi:hypothetical protein